MTDFAGGFRFQVSTATDPWRYQEFYRTIQSDIGIGVAPAVLVFGCSSGAEVQAIYQFWPDARVYACDVEEGLLEQTRSAAPNVVAFRSNPNEIRQRGPYDLICANSVFCRNPLPESNVSEILPFESFDEYVALLADQLRAGGLMMVYNSNYFVQDTSSAPDLTGINISRNWSAGYIPRLTRAGVVCATPVVVDNVLRSFTIDPEQRPASVARLSCALFRKERSREDRMLSINSGAQCLIYRPAAMAPILFPPVADCTRIYMPYFRSFTCTVGETLQSIKETYVTDFSSGGWILHGITHDPDAGTPDGRAANTCW